MTKLRNTATGKDHILELCPGKHEGCELCRKPSGFRAFCVTPKDGDVEWWHIIPEEGEQR